MGFPFLINLVSLDLNSIWPFEPNFLINTFLMKKLVLKRSLLCQPNKVLNPLAISLASPLAFVNMHCRGTLTNKAGATIYTAMEHSWQQLINVLVFKVTFFVFAF